MGCINDFCLLCTLKLTSTSFTSNIRLFNLIAWLCVNTFRLASRFTFTFFSPLIVAFVFFFYIFNFPPLRWTTLAFDSRLLREMTGENLSARQPVSSDTESKNSFQTTVLCVCMVADWMVNIARCCWWKKDLAFVILATWAVFQFLHSGVVCMLVVRLKAMQVQFNAFGISVILGFGKSLSFQSFLLWLLKKAMSSLWFLRSSLITGK